ncbi:hypothetical protein MBANPS3_008024 [Mucor bainieri]
MFPVNDKGLWESVLSSETVQKSSIKVQIKFMKPVRNGSESCWTVDARLAEDYEFEDEEELEDAIHQCGSKYLECCIVAGDEWFYVTSLEAYYHKHPEFDACAANFPTPYQPITLVQQLKCSLYNHPYAMLSIWVGVF